MILWSEVERRTQASTWILLLHSLHCYLVTDTHAEAASLLLLLFVRISAVPHLPHSDTHSQSANDATGLWSTNSSTYSARSPNFIFSPSSCNGKLDSCHCQLCSLTLPNLHIVMCMSVLESVVSVSLIPGYFFCSRFSRFPSVFPALRLRPISSLQSSASL